MEHYDSNMSTIDLEYGIASGTTTRAEHTTTGRKNLVKAVLGVAGIASIGAIGTVATVSSRSLSTGIDPAALSRRLDAQITAANPAAEPTASDSLAPIGLAGAPEPAYLRVPDFETCLSQQETKGGTTNWCMPKIKPSACVDASWGELSGADGNMGVPACAIDIDDNAYGNAGTGDNDDADDNEDADGNDDDADGNDNAGGNDAADEIDDSDDSDDAITIGSGKLSGYGKQVQEFVRGHKAEIAQFVADNKQALADAKAEIAEAIKTGDFDYAHYKQQLQALVDKHDLGEYAKKFEAYMAAHRAEIAQFVADNKQAVADVQEDIEDLIATGEFDFAHYKQQLQQSVTEHDLGAYRERLDAV